MAERLNKPHFGSVDVHGIPYDDGMALKEALPWAFTDYGSFFTVDIGPVKYFVNKPQ
jgi:hypothetical protein